MHVDLTISTIKRLHLYHTVIPPWIYRIPSELRSQAGLGLPSTVVGDHTGIVSAVCFLFCFGSVYTDYDGVGTNTVRCLMVTVFY